MRAAILATWLVLTISPLLARDRLAVTVMIKESEMERWYGKKNLPKLGEDTARVLASYLVTRCPFSHWEITLHPLTTAMEFSVDDEAGDVVLRVKAVIDEKPRRQWSIVWQKKDAFHVPPERDAATKIAEAFEGALIQKRWLEIAREIPLSRTAQPVRLSDTQFVLPLSYTEHSDLRHALFRVAGQWTVTNGTQKQTRDVSVFAMGDGGTDRYPASPAYEALAADSQSVEYLSRREAFEQWRARARTFVFQEVRLFDPGDVSDANSSFGN